MSDQHIYYQNKAVLDFESLALAPWRAGTITALAAVGKIEAIASAFERYAENLGYARAAAGARDVRNLAETLKRDISTGATFPPSVVDIDVGDGGGVLEVPIGGSSRGPASSGSSGSSFSSWGLVGLVALLLLGGRRSS